MNFKVDTKGSTKEETPLVVLPQKREDIYNPFSSQFKLATQQEDIVLAVPDNDVIIIDSIAGSSKEQPVSCIVKTPSGDRRFGDLVVGDKVLGRDGKATIVTGVYPQGVKDVYEVIFRDGAKTRCGIEHNWAVNSINMSHRDKFKTMTLSEMIDHGVKNKHGHYKMKIPLCSPVEYSKKELAVDPYVLGCFLGDGTFTTKSSSVNLSAHVEDKCIIDNVRSILGDKYDTEFPDKSRHTSKNGIQCLLSPATRLGGGSLNQNPFTKDMRELGLQGSKFIPVEYFYASVEQRMQLLQGLMDTDGSCSKNRTSFSNTNRELIDGIIRLVQSLGGTAIERNYVTCKDGKHAPVYSVNIKMFENPFRLKRKADKWSPSSKNPPSRYITSIEKLNYQEEQMCIMVDAEDHLYLTDEYIVTHNTCSQVVMAHNNKVPSLYLTFSKALALEAEDMFPPHVECRTIHSLAYREKGADIAHKLTRPRGRYRNVAGTGSEIAKFYKIDDIIVDREHSIKNTLIGLMVKQAIAKYEASAEITINKDCLPYGLIKTTKNKYPHINKGLWKEIEKELHNTIITYTKKLWKDRQDSTSEVLCSHDSYIKMWALTNPVINTKVLYVDELQDCAMVFMSIIKQQVGHCRIVVVGDPDQSLYKWRHSVNGLDMIEGKLLKLDQSFRFGQAAADLSMLILDNGRNMIGNPEMNTVVGSEGIIDTSKHYVKLFRNNATLIQEAVTTIAEGLKANIHVDVQDYVKMLESAEALFFGDTRKVKHEEILPFDNWEEFKDEAKNGGVLARVYTTVNGGDTKRIINLLRSHENTDNPDITLMTTHRSKGQTFDWVMLADDFGSCYNKAGEWEGLEEEERKLLYVACTRAKLGTEYNTTVKELVDRHAAINNKPDTEVLCQSNIDEYYEDGRVRVGDCIYNNEIQLLAAESSHLPWWDEDNQEWMNRGSQDQEFKLRQSMTELGLSQEYAEGKLPTSFERLLSVTGSNNSEYHQLERFLDYNITMEGSFEEGEPYYDAEGNQGWRFKL